MTPESIFAAALANVESRSIREWADSEHNRPLWLEHIRQIQAAGKTIDPLRLCAYIVITAMG